MHGSALPEGPNPAAPANSGQKRPARPQPLTGALGTRRGLFNKLVNSNLVLKMSLQWKHSSLGKMETREELNRQRDITKTQPVNFLTEMLQNVSEGFPRMRHNRSRPSKLT